MIAAELLLSARDLVHLRVTDAYSVHRVVYSLFEDVRSDEQKVKSEHSGFLYVDKGMLRDGSRRIILLSDRAPVTPEFGTLRCITVSEKFLAFSDYRFAVVANATKRKALPRPSDNSKTKGPIVPITGRDELVRWFREKSPVFWGFETTHVEVGAVTVARIQKKNTVIPLQQVEFTGTLHVTDREKFLQTFKTGIGRGKAFGCGLLQLSPLN